MDLTTTVDGRRALIPRAHHLRGMVADGVAIGVCRRGESLRLRLMRRFVGPLSCSRWLPLLYPGHFLRELGEASIELFFVGFKPLTQVFELRGELLLELADCSLFGIHRFL